MKFNVGDRVQNKASKRKAVVRFVADQFYILKFDDVDQDSTFVWCDDELECVDVPLTADKAVEMYHANRTIHDPWWSFKLILDYAKEHGIA